MNLENKRREILSNFGHLAYEMWQKGTALPKELNDQLEELSRVDEELNALHAQRFKDVGETNESALDLGEDAPGETEEPEAVQWEEAAEAVPLAKDAAQEIPEEEGPKADA